MRTRSEHAEQPCPAWGWLQARPPASPRPGRTPGPGSFPLPTETLQDWAPWAKMPCPGKRQEHLHFPLGSGRVRAMAALTYNFVCVLFYFTFTGKTLKTKEVQGVLHKWSAVDCLFESCVESHRQEGLSRAWLVFCFCFYFLILSHCIYQLLTHHFEGGGNVALLFVSFFIIFLL